MSGSLRDCFSLFFRDNLLEEICKLTNKEVKVYFEITGKILQLQKSKWNLIAS